MQRNYGVMVADQSRQGTDSQGITTYALAVAQAAAGACESNESIVVICNEEQAPDLSKDERLRLRIIPSALWRASPRLAALLLPRHQLFDGLDTIHFPRGFLPFGVPRGVASVVTINDTIPLAYANGIWKWPGSPLKPKTISYLLGSAAKRATRLVTHSTHSSDCIEAAWPGSASRSCTVGIGVPAVAPLLGPGLAQQLPDDFVLHLGSRFPHKGTSEALRIFRDAKRRGVLPQSTRLVVLGHLPAQAETDDVIHLPTSISDEAYAGVLQAARLLLFTSAMEGFGLPPLEALRLGTPAVFRAIRPGLDMYSFSLGAYGEDTGRPPLEAVDNALTARRDSSFEHAIAHAKGQLSITSFGHRLCQAYRSAVQR